MKSRPNHKTRLSAAAGRYPSAMGVLFTLGEPEADYAYSDLAESLRNYVPQLIELALDDESNNLKQTDPGVWAPLHALAVLGELRPVEAIEPLLELMAWDDDWIGDQLPEVYGAIGAPALPALQGYAADSSNDRWARGRALASLTAIAQAHEESREEIVRFFIAFLNRPESGSNVEEESLNAHLICDLGDLKATEAYDAIRGAFEEDIVDQTVVQLDDIERDFGMRPPIDFSALPASSQETGLNLTLRCRVCGRERLYHFARAYFDINYATHKPAGSTYSPLIVPERVTCPRCGAVDQYELTPLGELAIITAKLGAMAGHADRFADLQVISFTTKRWGPLHPREGLERYTDEVTRHPDDTELRIGYANSLRMLGYTDEAMAQYEQVLLTDPLHGEAMINIAQLMSLQGDTAAAIDAWERIKQSFDRLSLPKEDREMRRQEVEDTLIDLRNGIIPEYSKEWISMATSGDRGARPAEPTENIHPGQRKVGRNEPCPCGSGKKYKHCHGRK